MKQRTDLHGQVLSRALTFAKFLLASILAIALTGCGGAGGLLSNPRVSDADNDQVITIGDSIFALSGELQDFLEDRAGESFRRYTLSGAELTGGIVATSIADQYDIARADNPAIDTVVMDGGGNDILIPAIMFDPYDCKTQWYEFGQLSSSCKALIDDLYVEGVNLLNDMHADGVDNVIYLGYYYTKNGLFLLDSMEEAVDYGDMALANACNYSAVNCQFVDPRSAINDSDIIADGIHPNTNGSRKLADLVWPRLQPLL
ncbi:MAG: SGNH/GDSL hydrolase family protein [Marinobacter sp.]|nr:SGNH/GDSL hydrolase family protein [Marinobacter sp.]